MKSIFVEKWHFFYAHNFYQKSETEYENSKLVGALQPQNRPTWA